MFKQFYRFMLTRYGQTITLRRERPAVLAVQVVAKVRSVKADEIVGGVLQDDLLVVFEKPKRPWDDSDPKKGDRLVIGGNLSTIQFVYPLNESGAVVAYRVISRG